jgi:arsenate reductase
MAEGLCRHLKGDQIKAASAGIERHGLNRFAVKAMQEIGIDITGHTSKTVDDLGDEPFDYVVTVCGHAHETCPFFPAVTRVVHKGFEDPPRLAAEAQSEEEAMTHYRRVRDEIKAYIETLPESFC